MYPQFNFSLARAKTGNDESTTLKQRKTDKANGRVEKDSNLNQLWKKKFSLLRIKKTQKTKHM